MISLLLSNSNGSYDITNLVNSITWSGNYQQCSRSLTFNFISNSIDKRVPEISCDLGSAVSLKLDERLLFDGFIFSREKASNNSLIGISCFDKGFYLKRNQGTYKFVNQTPESIAAKICSDFGITIGEIAVTGIPITRNFIGVELYKIIMTAYTLAAQQNQKNYLALFRGEAFTVLEKKVTDETLILQGGSNLMYASCTESVEQMVNQVLIYDSDDKLIQTVKNEEYIRLYGVMQQYLKQSKEDEDIAGKAQKILKDKGYEQKMTVENLGNPACVTGNAVVVKEPYTGVYGLFYIDADSHTWKNGQYFNKLTVNFQNIMDEAEAGSLPNATGKKTTSDNTTNRKKNSEIFYYTPLSKQK